MSDGHFPGKKRSPGKNSSRNEEFLPHRNLQDPLRSGQLLFRYPDPLQEGTFQERRKRFFMDLHIPPDRDAGVSEAIREASTLTVHCPNTGSMKSCLKSGARVLFSDSGNPGRKLRYTAELIHSGKGWIGIHTGRTNLVAGEILRRGLLRGFEGYDHVRPEPVLREEGIRPDFLLLNSAEAIPQPCYVEVKNVTYLTGESLAFPDSPSERATRHVRELSRLVDRGMRACVLFIVSRPEAHRVRPASEIDPVFARSLLAAAEKGLEVRAVRVRFTKKGAFFAGELEVCL